MCDAQHTVEDVRLENIPSSRQEDTQRISSQILPPSDGVALVIDDSLPNREAKQADPTPADAVPEQSTTSWRMKVALFVAYLLWVFCIVAVHRICGEVDYQVQRSQEMCRPRSSLEITALWMAVTPASVAKWSIVTYPAELYFRFADVKHGSANRAMRWLFLLSVVLGIIQGTTATGWKYFGMERAAQVSGHFLYVIHIALVFACSVHVMMDELYKSSVSLRLRVSCCLFLMIVTLLVLHCAKNLGLFPPSLFLLVILVFVVLVWSFYMTPTFGAWRVGCNKLQQKWNNCECSCDSFCLEKCCQRRCSREESNAGNDDETISDWMKSNNVWAETVHTAITQTYGIEYMMHFETLSMEEVELVRVGEDEEILQELCAEFKSQFVNTQMLRNDFVGVLFIGVAIDGMAVTFKNVFWVLFPSGSTYPAGQLLWRYTLWSLLMFISQQLWKVVCQLTFPREVLATVVLPTFWIQDLFDAMIFLNVGSTSAGGIDPSSLVRLSFFEFAQTVVRDSGILFDLWALVRCQPRRLSEKCLQNFEFRVVHAEMDFISESMSKVVVIGLILCERLFTLLEKPVRSPHVDLSTKSGFNSLNNFLVLIFVATLFLTQSSIILCTRNYLCWCRETFFWLIEKATSKNEGFMAGKRNSIFRDYSFFEPKLRGYNLVCGQYFCFMLCIMVVTLNEVYS